MCNRLFNWQFFSKFTKVSSVRQWSGRPGLNPRSRHTKDFKNGTWYLLALLSARIEDKVEQSKERSSTLPYTLV